MQPILAAVEINDVVTPAVEVANSVVSPPVGVETSKNSLRVNRRIRKGVLTRAVAAMVKYNDHDESQNELIGMEKLEVASKNENELVEMSEDELHLLRTQQCMEYGFPSPLSEDELKQTDWELVSNYNDSMLATEHKFLSIEELEMIPRRHPKFKFCHPGALYDDQTKSADWFYADSVVQEVKLQSQKQTRYFVIRWVGYEDT